MANGRFPVALANTTYTVTVKGCPNLNGTIVPSQAYIVVLIPRDRNSRADGLLKYGLQQPND
jgi:hypothetical protein